MHTKTLSTITVTVSPISLDSEITNNIVNTLRLVPVITHIATGTLQFIE